MPKEQAKLKILQEYSKRSLAILTLSADSGGKSLNPSGSALLRRGGGSPGNLLMSLALEAVPHTGAICTHKHIGDCSHRSNKDR
jgi:hypothetical protein